MKAALLGTAKLLPAEEQALREAGLRIVAVMPRAYPEDLARIDQNPCVEAFVLAPSCRPLAMQAAGYKPTYILMHSSQGRAPAAEAEAWAAEAPDRRKAEPAAKGECRMWEFTGLAKVELPLTTP